MFEQSFLTPPNKTRKAWSTTVSFLGQIVLVGVAILVPLLYPDAMPRAFLAGVLQAPTPPPGPQPPRLNAVQVVETRIIREYTGGHLLMPTEIPKTIKLIDDKDAPSVEAGNGVGVPGGTGIPGGDGVINSIARSAANFVPPPPPPPVEHKPAATTKPVERIKVGGRVQEALILRRVLPVYPALAKQARIQGTVRLVGIIATDGTIQQLQVIQGHPLLIAAAVDAVRQWIYRPTMLNGEPVEVVAPIEVNFKLSQ